MKRVIILGYGKLAKLILKALSTISKSEIKVEAVFDIEDIVNKYNNTIISDSDLSIYEIGTLWEYISTHHVDGCFILTPSDLRDMLPLIEMLASKKIQIVTSCEEAFYPNNSTPEAAKYIDQLCKKYEVKIAGSGFREAIWGKLTLLLCEASYSIKEISLYGEYSLNGCNQIALYKHGVNMTDMEFHKNVVEANYPAMMWNIHGWICNKLTIEPVSWDKCTYPIHDEKNIIGSCTCIVTKTKENLKITSQSVGRMSNEYFPATIKISINGIPNMSVEMKDIEATEISANALLTKMLEFLDINTRLV